MSEEYVKNLENIIKQMLKPLKGIPFSLIIESISGKKVIPFNVSDNQDKIVLEKLMLVASNACKEINKNGIKRDRVNEVGNDIEVYVRNELNKINYKAYIPSSRDGTKKSVGYPDIEFKDEFNRTNYLECKTYNIKNVNATQRTFYFSPSNNFKINSDAHHFLISFEMFQFKVNFFKTKSWKIINLDKLLVDVKYEFNTNNKVLYDHKIILAQGEIF